MRGWLCGAAGFAVRLSYLAKSETRFRHSLRMGYMEDNFLRDVTGDRETDPYVDVEPLGGVIVR